MQEPTLAEEIITIVQSVANNNPAPTLCVITKIYSDQNHVDIETKDGTLTYIPTISNNLQVGNPGVLIYLDGNYENQIIITK